MNSSIQYAVLFCCVLLLISCGGGGGADSDNGTGQNSVISPTTSWKGPTALANPTLGSDGSGQNMEPTLLQDASANVSALWYRWDGTAVSLYAAQKSASGAWTSPQRIENSDNDAVCKRNVTGCDRETPAVIDSNGNITVAWPSWDGVQWQLAVNRYVPAQGWGSQTVFSSSAAVFQDGVALTSANIMVDHAGRVTVVWFSGQSANSPLGNYWYAHFDGKNWSSAQLSTTTAFLFTDWAIEPVSGEVSFAWYSSSSGGFVARSFKPGSGWESEALLLATASTSQAKVSLLYDSAASLTALIQRNPSSGFEVWANRRASTANWGTSELIASSGSDVYDSEAPKLAATSDGGIMALLKWQPLISTSVSPSLENWRLQYVTYTDAGGWSSAAELCCSGNYYRGPFAVGSGSNGSVYVMDQSNARPGSTLPANISLWHFASLQGTTTTPADITDSALSGSSSSRFASTPNGYAVIAYALREGAVRVNRFVPGVGWVGNEAVAALAAAEAARPGVVIEDLNVSPSGHVFVLYYDVDYETYAGAYFDPATGWDAPGPLSGRSSRAFFSVDGATSVIDNSGTVTALTNLATAGPGLQAFSGKGAIDVAFTSNITPRSAPQPPAQVSGGGSTSICSGTNNNAPLLSNYIDRNFSYIRSCGNAEVQTGSLIRGADVYFDAYLNAINTLGCSEAEAYPTYMAHQETSLLAKRTADVLGCTR